MSDDSVKVDEKRVIDTKSPATAPDKAETEKRKAVGDFSKDGGKNSMRVRVHSPFRNYYDGMAFSLSAENATGPFDILPRHHNFISLLLPCDIVIRTVDEGERRVRISGGILHVKADQVVVFLDV